MALRIMKHSGKFKTLDKQKLWPPRDLWKIVINTVSTWKVNGFKGAFSGLRQFLATESSLKLMKNALYFSVRTLFVLKMVFDR